MFRLSAVNDDCCWIGRLAEMNEWINTRKQWKRNEKNQVRNVHKYLPTFFSFTCETKTVWTTQNVKKKVKKKQIGKLFDKLNFHRCSLSSFNIFDADWCRIMQQWMISNAHTLHKCFTYFIFSVWWIYLHMCLCLYNVKKTKKQLRER